MPKLDFLNHQFVDKKFSDDTLLITQKLPENSFINELDWTQYSFLFRNGDIRFQQFLVYFSVKIWLIRLVILYSKDYANRKWTILDYVS